MLSHLNSAGVPPKQGDTIVIETKKNKGKKVILTVQEVIDCDGSVEIIIQKSKNKYFNWEMFRKGESWVWRVWNLGDVAFTASTNSMLKVDDI